MLVKTAEIVLALLSLGTRLPAAEAPAAPTANNAAPPPAVAAPAATNQTASPAPPSAAAVSTDKQPDLAAQPSVGVSNEVAVLAGENGTNGLRLNFRGAPLNLVLDYLSDAAGFIINKETEVRGTVDVWSKEAVSKDEAVELLNSVLRKNGYAVVRNGRILNIVSMENIKTSDLDINNGNKWEDVDKSDEVVTQIIPVRYASATQLMNNLQILLPTSATLSVNESANSLILVATKRDIRRMLKIVSSLDSSIANVSTIKVFVLRYADAKQLATEIQQLFTPQGANQGPGGMRAQIFNMMRGGGGFGGPGGGPGGPGGAGAGSSGGGNGTKVTAAADDYANAVIVSASTELMDTISNMVKEIDQPISNITELRVFHLLNADPTEVADQFGQLFPDDTKTASTQNQGFGGFRFGGGPGFRGGAAQASPSDRSIKKSRVLAVPDPRTSSLLVSAPSELMPQIEQMIEKLDSSSAKREVVKVYDLQNADPQDVNQILQDLFQRSGNVRANNNNTRTSLLGTGNPLTQRATQQQQSTTTSTSPFGTGTSGRGGF
jgi:type II secretory pathway component GspD/PulD (secretin)